MINKFIKEGDRVELTQVGGKVRLAEDGSELRKQYYTKISAITSEDTLELLMPMEKTKLILLPIDAEYNVVVYTEGGLYQCFARVIDRYKADGMFFLAIELTSNLRKYQRREYYRFSCALE
ncbi:MAG: flagellar brake protein, partial [Lachnospiraceae bacterium]|nr:flagellar brake protein [Lachnospiraceae bacterium]